MVHFDRIVGGVPAEITAASLMGSLLPNDPPVFFNCGLYSNKPVRLNGGKAQKYLQLGCLLSDRVQALPYL